MDGSTGDGRGMLNSAEIELSNDASPNFGLTGFWGSWSNFRCVLALSHISRLASQIFLHYISN
jgi:hypothetical protein